MSNSSTPEKRVGGNIERNLQTDEATKFTHEFFESFKELGDLLDAHGRDLTLKYINVSRDLRDEEYFHGVLMKDSQVAADSFRQKRINTMILRSPFGATEGAISIYRNEILPGVDPEGNTAIFSSQIMHMYPSTVIDWYNTMDVAVPIEPHSAYTSGKHGPYIHFGRESDGTDAFLLHNDIDTRHTYQLDFYDTGAGVMDMVEKGLTTPRDALWFVNAYILDGFDVDTIVPED